MVTLEDEGRLSADHHAYRKGHSTETALENAVSLIEEQFDRNGYMVD